MHNERLPIHTLAPARLVAVVLAVGAALKFLAQFL
jgi:hypothetical protein